LIDAGGDSGGGTVANNAAAFRAQAYSHSLLPVIRCDLRAIHKSLQAVPAFFAADRPFCLIPRSGLPGR